MILHAPLRDQGAIYLRAKHFSVLSSITMKRQSLESMGVAIRPTGRGVRYALPWIKYRGFRRNGWGMILYAALPCIPAMCVPHVIFRFAQSHGGLGPTSPIVFECFEVSWVAMCGLFVLLFGAVGAIAICKGGRCFIWLSPNGIQTIHFRGGELQTSWFALSELKQLAVRDVAGEPVLVAIGEKEVKRIAEDYSLELLAALAMNIAEWINSRGRNATASR